MVAKVVRVVGWIARRIARVVWISTMVLVPLFGFWVASSLAAYQNASQWLALLVGLALFPILPIGWDLFFVWRRSKQPPRPAILTRTDRLVLRTLFINGVFLAATFYAKPHVAFRALAVRGDWILDGYDGPIASRVRGTLLGLADLFAQRIQSETKIYGPSDKAPEPEPKKPEPPAPIPAKPRMPAYDEWAYPVSAPVDPIVKDMPEQATVQDAGKYLAERIKEPKALVKALHDFVDLRLSYDYATLDAYRTGKLDDAQPQDAETVFRTHKAVCAGYARLMSALGDAAGIEIAFIGGYARDSQQITPSDESAALSATLEGYLHAWNAAHLGDEWLLIDATWDDRDDGPPETTYLFTPPELFVYQHLPDTEEWQLLDKHITMGEFVRQPLLTPEVARFGISLVEPARSQVTVTGSVAIQLANPKHAKVVAEIAPAGSKDPGARCKIDGDTRISCPVGSGQFEVRMFATDKIDGDVIHYDYFGSLQVNGR